MKRLMDLNISILWMKNDILPPQKIREKQLHSGLQDEESMSSSEKNVDEHFEKEFKSFMNQHVESSWRTPVIKEWSNERKEKLKTQGESLQWLDGSSRWNNWENLELREKNR